MDTKKQCEYGAKCYRKNSQHLEEYFHPEEVKKAAIETTGKRRRKDCSPKKILKQTKLDFFQRATPLDVQRQVVRPMRDAQHDPKPNISPRQNTTTRRKKHPTPLAKSVIEESSDEENETDTSGVGDVTSNSWIFQQGNKTEEKDENDTKIAENLTVEEKIKKLFLVDMPRDFYEFYKFCESLDAKKPTDVFVEFGLKLVGPFDVLTGRLSPGNVTSELALCHWRFFMDPPEFQTVVVADKGLHFGYWRDEPLTKDPFIVSNTVPDCKIKPESPTLFGATIRYFDNYLKRCDPFQKVNIANVLSKLKQWAEDRDIDISSSNDIMAQRKKNTVAKTFNDWGIVVPFDKKTEVGYRPLLETNGNLKKLCQAAINAGVRNSPQMEEIERCLNAANIANDESDFGTGLELGIDLFCMGSKIFDDFVEHLLTTAYSLLDRPEWKKVIIAHLKHRRTDMELSVIK